MGGDAGAASSSGPPRTSLAHDRGPLHLAIIVTLTLIALVIYSLRIFTRVKLLRAFGIDDVFMFLAALCAVGIFITFTGSVELGLGQELENVASSVSQSKQIGPWVLALKSVNIFGLGVVKLSAALALLPESNSNLHAYVYIFRGIIIMGTTFVVFCQTLEWCASLLVQCAPLVAVWDLSNSENVTCMSQTESQHWAMANHVTNACTSFILVFCAVPTVLNPSFKVGVRLYLAAVTAVAFFSCAIAVVRIETVLSSWAEIGGRGRYDLSFMTWGAVELMAAMIAVNLGALMPLCGISKATGEKAQIPRSIPKISGPVAGSAVHVSHADVDSIFSADPSPISKMKSSNRLSNQTITYRPNTAYFPSGYNNPGITRFHDDESNLDFDIEIPSTRSPRKLKKPPPTSRFSGSTTYTVDTRRISDWSQFSGFTYYSQNASPESGNMQENTDSSRVGGNELVEIIEDSGSKREDKADAGDQQAEIRVFSEGGRSGEFPAIFLEDDSKYVYSSRA